MWMQDEHVEESSGNSKDEQIDDDNGKHCNNENRSDVNSAENLFCFTKDDSSIDLLTKQFENPLLNANVQISMLKMNTRVSKIMSKKTAKTKIWILLPSGEAYFV